MGTATVKLRTPERLFNLYDEISRRSLGLIRKERYGYWLRCIAFISKEVVFEQYTVMN